jgi:hypothetical protein
MAVIGKRHARKQARTRTHTLCLSVREGVGWGVRWDADDYRTSGSVAGSPGITALAATAPPAPSTKPASGVTSWEIDTGSVRGLSSPSIPLKRFCALLPRSTKFVPVEGFSSASPSEPGPFCCCIVSNGSIDVLPAAGEERDGRPPSFIRVSAPAAVPAMKDDDPLASGRKEAGPFTNASDTSSTQIPAMAKRPMTAHDLPAANPI